jgi:hypothetical protein
MKPDITASTYHGITQFIKELVALPGSTVLASVGLNYHNNSHHSSAAENKVTVARSDHHISQDTDNNGLIKRQD